MRVIPEGPGIGRREFVDEAFAGPDRRLGEAWHAIHRIGQPDAVPMHGGVLIEPVLDRNTHRLSLTEAQGRAGYLAVIGPDPGVRLLAADHRGYRLCCGQPDMAQAAGIRGCWWGIGVKPADAVDGPASTKSQ